MGTLKIGSAKNMVGVTIDPRTVLFNDKNVKYIKSGLTEIWSNIKPLVPTLTSNNGSDGGVASASKEFNNYAAWKVFDGDDTSSWSAADVKGSSVQYDFKKPTIVNAITIKPEKADGFLPSCKDYKIEASNDGSEWVELYSGVCGDSGEKTTHSIKNTVAYMIYKCTVVTSYRENQSYSISTLQFYGYQLKALIPTMTSNTTPSGEAFASSILAGWDAWYAFNGTNKDSNDIWSSDSYVTDCYIGYKFTKPICVKSFSITNRNHTSGIYPVKTVQLQGSNDDEQWFNVGEQFTNNNGANVTSTFNVTNDTKYNYYRLHIIDGYDSYSVIIGKLQMYG